MKYIFIIMLMISSSLVSAQEEQEESDGVKLDISQIRWSLEASCKSKQGKLQFENLSGKIGERPKSVCYRYICDIPNLSQKKAAEEGNQIAINDVQVNCLNEDISPAVVQDLRQWGKALKEDAVASPKRGVSSSAHKQ